MGMSGASSSIVVGPKRMIVGWIRVATKRDICSNTESGNPQAVNGRGIGIEREYDLYQNFESRECGVVDFKSNTEYFKSNQ